MQGPCLVSFLHTVEGLGAFYCDAGLGVMGYFVSVQSAQPVTYQCMTKISRRLSNHMGFSAIYHGGCRTSSISEFTLILDLDDMAVVEPRVS
jgi:hypothetical protein